jgi:hypothetical protein
LEKKKSFEAQENKTGLTFSTEKDKGEMTPPPEKVKRLNGNGDDSSNSIKVDTSNLMIDKGDNIDLNNDDVSLNYLEDINTAK